MPLPVIYDKPIVRPGFVSNASWLTDPVTNDDGELELPYVKIDGTVGSVVFKLGSGYSYPERNLCLPSSAGIDDMSEEMIVAHLRMGAAISGTIPGSQEFRDMYLDSGSGEVVNAQYFQTAIGEMRIHDVDPVSDVYCNIAVKKGSNGTPRTISVEYGDILSKDGKFVYAPSTQLLVFAGKIKKEYSAYVQDGVTRLTQGQADNIISAANAWAPWI